MKKRSFVVFAALLVMFGACFAAGMPEFTADMISKSNGETTQAKVYYSANKFRLEANDTISIFRMDKNIVWTTMPGEKVYMEMKLTEKDKTYTSSKVQGEVSRTKLGRETVNGVTCDKFKVVSKSNGKTTTVFQWISADGIQVKTEAADGSWSMQYKNIKRGKIDPSVFNVPKGYSKFSMPDF